MGSLVEREFYFEKLAEWFPPKRDRCAPTALANVMAAFEAYPWDCYRIDAVCMWSRLLPVLTEEKYAIFVEREKGGIRLFPELFSSEQRAGDGVRAPSLALGTAIPHLDRLTERVRRFCLLPSRRAVCLQLGGYDQDGV